MKHSDTNAAVINNDAKENSSTLKKFSTVELVLVGMFAAIMAVISQISLPMPGGVPITIQLFGITLIGVVLGWKLGVLSTLVYILIGAVGVPVFANFRGGLSSLTGMAGGYILGWPLLTILAGIRPSRFSKRMNAALSILLIVIGVLADECIGGLQWAFLSGEKTYPMIMAYSFGAFIPKDIVISIIALFVGEQVRKPMVRGGFLTIK